MELSSLRSGAAIVLCSGPGVPPYLASVWSPNSTRMVKILSVFSRLSSTYLLLPLPLLSLTTLEPSRSCAAALPAMTWLRASARCAFCVLLSGPSRSWACCRTGAGSCRCTAPAPVRVLASATAKVANVAEAAASVTPIAAALNVQDLLVT
ncbi:hypothetical protein SGPA1_30097 [Streptomyces misionensis JCM 4497]